FTYSPPAVGSEELVGRRNHVHFDARPLMTHDAQGPARVIVRSHHDHTAGVELFELRQKRARFVASGKRLVRKWDEPGGGITAPQRERNGQLVLVEVVK